MIAAAAQPEPMPGVASPHVTAAGSAEKTYKFSSEPKPLIAAGRKKFRDPYAEERQPAPVNIMHDRRIFRGNTYASTVLPVNAQQDPVQVHRQNEVRRRLRARRRAENQRCVRTPDPAAGRKNADIQTDAFLEEMANVVPEADAQTQTDAFLDRAPSPWYVPQKSGADAETQICDGELFDFEYEVVPIVDVIAEKTLEQSLMEIMEEEELATLKKRQEEYEATWAAAVVEQQRLEENERRRTEEKERRVAERLRVLAEKGNVASKIAARAFAKGYLSELVPNTLSTLRRNGFYYDTVMREVESQFLPWIGAEVVNKVERLRAARILADDIIKFALFKMKGCS